MGRWTATILCAVAALPLCALRAAELALANESLEMVFGTDVQGGLCGLRNVPCDVRFLTPAQPPASDCSPWLLVLRRSDGSRREVTAKDAAELTPKLSGRALELTWSGVRTGGVGGELRVTMQVRLLPTDGKSRWELSVEGDADGALWDVQFPRLLGLEGPAHDELALPEYWGRLVRDPVGSGLQVTLDYPQPASMQWIAWWGTESRRAPELAPREDAVLESGWRPDLRDAAGLYLAAEDGDGWHKRIAVSSRTVPGRLSWWLHHLPPLDQWPIAEGVRPVSYSLPYPVVLTAFRGDYHEAASLYRDWARRAVWCRRGTIGTWPAAAPARGSAAEAVWVPNWFRQVAFWAKFYHEPAKVLPEWAAYRRWLQVPMASHYYRYTVAPFDDNYPEPLPADPYLVPGMLAARHLGVPPLPYTNGVIWDSDTQSWLRENGLAAAIKDEEGRMVPWDIGGQVFAHMCPVEQWRAKLRETTRKLVGEHAMAGVYLDCLAATPAMPCYDPRHGHSLHGGDHRAKDLRRLLEELRLDARRLSPGAAFFTEEIGEQFLDVMDGFLTLDLTRAGLHPGQQVFPVFSVVYHPYALNFGSDASLDLDPAWFALQMGTLFTWGAVPLLSATVAQPPQEGDANSEMLRDLVQAYHRVGTPFLQGGQWERLVTMPDTGVRPAASLALTSRPHTVDWAPAGSSPRQWQGPAVLGSAWRQGNTVGVALVNITPEAQTATLWADCAGLGLPESSQVTALWPDSASVPPGGEGSYRLVLAPRRVAVLALADVSRTWRRQPLDRCPWDLLAAVDGPLPERAETDGCLRACDDGPVVHQFGPDGVALTATAIDAQGLLVRRIAHQAEVRGPEADGQSLPRRRLDQPFALLRCLPHQVIRGEPRVTVLGGDDDWLLCRVAGSCRIGFSRAGIVCRRTGDGKESEFATATAAEVPAGPGETVVAFWAAGDELAEAVAERAAACSTAVTEADGVRLAVAALTEAPSPEAVAALSRALAAHLEACGKAPGLAAPGSALAALVQRTNALVSGLTGMEAVLLAEDDWLTPGLPKDVTLVTRGVALPGEARFLGLADVPAGSLDVSALPASPGARVVTARALLRSEDYVERLVPVAGQVRGAVGPEEAVLSPLLWLDSNRPVAVSSSRQAPVVLAGQECATELTVRNLSPAELNLAVTTAVPPGWTITVSPPELRLAPLASRPVQLVLAAPPEARSQSVAFRLKTLWGVGQERGFVTEVRCAVQERIGVLRQEKREPPAPTPARLRQRNQVVFWVRAGEEVAVTVRNLRVTQYQDAATVRLLGPTLAPVATAQVAVDRQAVLTTGAATADGVYHLLVDVGSGSVEIAADGRPFAEVASAESPLSLFCSPIRRWFYVPRSAQQFLLHARDGGVAETARIRVLSPAGTVVFERDGNWAGEAHRIPVLPEAAGGVWLLECQPLQDVSLWLAGDVCPYLSDDPSEVPVPSAESGRP